MTPLKPHLIRSFYDWIVENNLTPHLLVNTENTAAVVPDEFITDGKIVLNIRPAAIQGLSLGKETIEFDARFSGNPMHISIPVPAVLAIYAQENGKGMVFDNEDDNPTLPPEDLGSKPTLRVVK